MRSDEYLLSRVKPAPYARLRKRYLAQKRRWELLQAEIQRMQALEKEMEPHWVKQVIVPLARLLVQQLPAGTTFEVMGPFGLDSEMVVCFQHGRKRRSITFVGGWGMDLAVRDYTQRKSNYAPGTIGEMNGFNFGRVAVPVDAEAAWFLQFLGKGS